jgi:hypothetical protein
MQPMEPPVRIAIQDAWGNTQPDATGTATIRVEGTGIIVADNVVGGIAEFPGLRINAVGSGRRLGALFIDSQPALSAPFNVLP